MGTREAGLHATRWPLPMQVSGATIVPSVLGLTQRAGKAYLEVMIRDTVRAMVKALPDIREDGNALLVDAAWEVTVLAGRNAAPVSIPGVARVTLENEFAVIETVKNQRFVILLDEVRGVSAEPSPTDRKGRKTGFA